MQSDKWTEYDENLKNAVDWVKVAQEVMGLQVVMPLTIPENGWVPCHSLDGDDKNPSASYNVHTGYYKDHRAGRADEKAIGPYDLMYELGIGKTPADNKKTIAKMFDIKVPRQSKNECEHGVRWTQWNNNLAQRYCAVKPPITVEGLHRAGAQMCMRFNDHCIALPVCENDPVGIVGWVFICSNGKPFPSNNAKSIYKGTEKGFICSEETMRVINEGVGLDIYWTEGEPDMLAGLSKFPNSIFVTSPHGCDKPLSSIHRTAVLIGDHRWHLIADADEPGIRGAKKRSSSVENKIRVFVPPYDVVQKHGKDYRDLLQEKTLGHPLDGMVEHSLGAPSGEGPQGQDSAPVHNLQEARGVLQSLGISVFPEAESNNVMIYFDKTNLTKKVTEFRYLCYEDFLRFGGEKFGSVVYATQTEVEDYGGGKGILFSEFKKMLAIAAASASDAAYKQIGMGVWPAEDNQDFSHLALVKRGGLYSYKGGVLTKELQPVIGDKCADIATSKNWFDENLLAKYVGEAADPKWRAEVVKSLHIFFSQWNWENPDMPTLCVALYLATWIQSVHRWRPTVALVGESNSGKSSLFNSINQLFLGLGEVFSGSTVAGIFQAIKHHCFPVFIDEFDTGKHQMKMLERIRCVSRDGSTVAYGTSGQGGKRYLSQHIFWIGGIHASSDKQADVNRMIWLGLLKAKDNATTIKPVPAEFMRYLGHKALACALVACEESVKLFEQLSHSENQSVTSRYRESYSVPYSVLAAVMGSDYESANGMLSCYLDQYVIPKVSEELIDSDQEELLNDILGAVVRLTRGPLKDQTAFVAEILFEDKYAAYRDDLRTHGIGYVVPKKSSEVRVALATKMMIGSSGILGKTKWAGVHGLNQILKRLPKSLGVTVENQRFSGKMTKCLTMDFKALKEWSLTQDSQ